MAKIKLTNGVQLATSSLEDSAIARYPNMSNCLVNDSHSWTATADCLVFAKADEYGAYYLYIDNVSTFYTGNGGFIAFLLKKGQKVNGYQSHVTIKAYGLTGPE